MKATEATGTAAGEGPAGAGKGPVGHGSAAAGWRVWVLAARPRTLPAALVPVLLGTAAAFDAGHFGGWAALLCALFAMLVQVASNFANDYQDAARGADTASRIGPTRAVASGLVAPAAMRRATYGTLVVAFGVGCGLLPYGGWPLLVLGGTCLAGALIYTGGGLALGYKGWGEVLVFLFFGLVAVLGTYWVQAATLAPTPLLLAVVAGLLTSNILTVNNVRDVAGDALAGKRTLAVRFGATAARRLYQTGAALAALAPVALVGVGQSPWVLVALLVGVPLAVIEGRRLEGARTGPEFGACLAGTVRFLVVYGVVLALAVAAP